MHCIVNILQVANFIQMHKALWGPINRVCLGNKYICESVLLMWLLLQSIWLISHLGQGNTDPFNFLYLPHNSLFSVESTK